MSELLRMANELIQIDQGTRGGWPCHGDYPCLYTDEVITVIKGYQDLIRRMVEVLDCGAFYKATTVSNLEFVIEGESKVNQVLMAIVEAKTSIPEVNHE